MNTETPATVCVPNFYITGAAATAVKAAENAESRSKSIAELAKVDPSWVAEATASAKDATDAKDAAQDATAAAVRDDIKSTFRAAGKAVEACCRWRKRRRE